MSEKGISKNALVAGLMVAILVSVLVSAGIATLVVKEGLQGERGPTGEKGDPGTVAVDITAFITQNWNDGLNIHEIEGWIVNWGTDTAYDIKLTITWWYGSEKEHSELIYIETLEGHKFEYISETYYFEGQGHPFYYDVTWT